MKASSEKEKADFQYLLNAYLEGTLTEEGINTLFDYIQKDISGSERIMLRESMRSFQSKLAGRGGLKEEQSKRIRERLMKEIKPRPAIFIFSSRWRIYAAAALILILAGAGYWLFLKSRSASPVQVAEHSRKGAKFKNDIPPGDNKAVLTLADGSSIILDSAASGELSRQGNTKIVKPANGRLDYKTEAAAGPDANNRQGAAVVTYNVITTPRGGQYQVTLSDGTRIWLNSASSLRFPTVFTGSKRMIELKGEAYIEAAPYKDFPFEVAVENMTVRVLGTEFNIMAYPDEKAIITTLVTGAVQVMQAGNIALLKPGEHAVGENDKLRIKKANVEEETAWKNGLIQYSRASIQQIMRQVSRWYNVDVVYEGDMSNKDFACAVSRRANVSELLNVLELTGAVHFDIDGNKIIVKP